MTEGVLVDLRAGNWCCNGSEQHSWGRRGIPALRQQEEVCLKFFLVYDWSSIAVMCLPLSLRTAPVLSVSCAVHVYA